MPINQILSSKIPTKKPQVDPILPQPNTTEFIIVPDLDVMDTEDLVESKQDTVGQKPEPTYDPKLAVPVGLNENISSSNQEHEYKSDSSHSGGNYQYNNIHQNHERLRLLSATSWVLTTFLMTTVILGSIYFYFTYEDQRTKISNLELQIATINTKSPEVKGAVDNEDTKQEINLNSNLNKDTEESLKNIVKPLAIGENISIKDNNEFSDKFTFTEEPSPVPYFKNQNGTLSKYYYIQPSNQSLKDGLDIFSLENDGSFNEKELLNYIQKNNDPSFKLLTAKTNTLNDVKLSVIESTKNSKIKYFIGATESHLYVIVWNNQSINNTNTSKLNNYLKSIIADISLN